MNELPDFRTCQHRIDGGKAGPLERLIYFHEPAGTDAEIFRRDLLEVINDLEGKQ